MESFISKKVSKHAYQKWMRKNGETFALVCACIISLVLVLVSGILIGFMQYQSRLLNSSADISSGDIILQAELDGLMRQEQASLDAYRDDKEKTKVLYESKQQEVHFRVDRICRSLKIEAAQDYIRCAAFLQTIPFNDQEPGTAPLPDADAKTPPAPIPSFDDKSVLNSITAALGLTPVQAEILAMHRNELAPIARINVESFTSLFPDYFRANSAFLSKCNRILRLASGMNSYRSFSVGDCYLSSQLPDTLAVQDLPFTLLQQPAAVAAPAAVPVQPVPGQTPADQPAAALSGTEKPEAEPDPSATATTAATTATTATNGPATTASAAGGTTASTPATVPAPVAADTPPIPIPIGSNINNDTSVDKLSNNQSSSDYAARQRNFELVSQYLFYNSVSFGLLKNILISPPDFLAFSLTGLCGMLGGLLKIILTASQTGKSPTWRAFWIIMLLGLICALIFYSLFRGGYLAISNEDPKTAAVGLNPFVIALLALASGLLSDRAIAAFKTRSNVYFGDANYDLIDRWGFGLAAALPTEPKALAEIAQKCRVDSAKLQAWSDEREAVPIEAQDDLSLILGRTRRSLFTQDPPHQDGSAE